MATLSFTPNLLRHVPTPSARIAGATVHQVLDNYFQGNPEVRTYVLDDQGMVREHVTIFVNQEMIRDRHGLTDQVNEHDEIFVMQALSGG
ncbi:MoaD/ThiS family protein [Sedimenticola hydrogenitrophicus]|uniref:MoaD/ThiS family protein n=1 Tax=Sedimenticola hydrogenitrophicus TaxID=2967975 RepID=UPI0021A7CF0A|nr:MoaD/ThiS family protein [Sedimenticola hydrogenitrophicus]